MIVELTPPFSSLGQKPRRIGILPTIRLDVLTLLSDPNSHPPIIHLPQILFDVYKIHGHMFKRSPVMLLIGGSFPGAYGPCDS